MSSAQLAAPDVVSTGCESRVTRRTSSPTAGVGISSRSLESHRLRAACSRARPGIARTPSRWLSSPWAAGKAGHRRLLRKSRHAPRSLTLAAPSEMTFIAMGDPMGHGGLTRQSSSEGRLLTRSAQKRRCAAKGARRPSAWRRVCDVTETQNGRRRPFCCSRGRGASLLQLIFPFEDGAPGASPTRAPNVQPTPIPSVLSPAGGVG
jgi:hypothetical protein